MNPLEPSDRQNVTGDRNQAIGEMSGGIVIALLGWYWYRRRR